MSKAINSELFEEPNEKFGFHINIEDNQRILFSGRFGIGKTTFLKYFFKEQDEVYNSIHLYPINYSVLENEDIFSYLKYDILVTLFSNEKYPIKADYYSFLKSWDSYLLENLSKVVATTMLLIPKVGKQLNQFVKELKVLAKDFKQIKDSAPKQEMDEINHFLTQFHNTEGGLYESNVITRLIQEWLKDIKNSGKKNVLIIDDLDRIDPNHIFRLLNVFSAHFDSRDQLESKNKFGFDQVIFVCDVNNIKNVFNHTFGIKSDFNGYIDKFFSKAIYRFDNKVTVSSILEKIIFSSELNFKNREGNLMVLPGLKRRQETIVIILRELINRNRINLRSLFKFSNQAIEIPEMEYQIKNERISPIENYFLSSVYIISMYLGDLSLLKTIINEIDDFHITNTDHPALFVGDLILISDIIQSKQKMNSLWGGGNLHNIKFDITIDENSRYHGEYSIYGKSQNTNVYSGFLSNFNENEIEIDPNLLPSGSFDYTKLIKHTINMIAL